MGQRCSLPLFRSIDIPIHIHGTHNCFPATTKELTHRNRVCMTWKTQMIYDLNLSWKTSSPLYSENNVYIEILQCAPCRMEPRRKPDVGFGHWPSSSVMWSLWPPAMFLAFSFIRLTLGSFVSTRKIPQLKSENNSGKKDLQHKLHVWTAPEICQFNTLLFLRVFYLPSEELRNLTANEKSQQNSAQSRC